MSNLYHLIYASKERYKFTKDEVYDLLSKARQANKKIDVTGMLLYEEASLFQILEGDYDVINTLFDKISSDNRHQKITKIIFEAIPERRFSDWSMGYSPISRDEMHKIDGMNDFFKDGSCLADIDSGRAKKLLMAFSQGRWRLE